MLIAGIGLNFLDSAWVVRVSNAAIGRQVAAALLVFTLPKTMPTERKYEGEICPDLGSDIVVVPILLGRGVRLWDGLEGLEQDYRIETTSSPSGVTHINSHVRCLTTALVYTSVRGGRPPLAHGAVSSRPVAPRKENSPRATTACRCLRVAWRENSLRRIARSQRCALNSRNWRRAITRWVSESEGKGARNATA